MPPIPSKLTEDAKEVIESLERRARFVKEDTIPRLHACGSPSPPTLGSANGNIDPVKEQQRLSEEVRDELGVLARDIENLSMMVDDQSGERSRRELAGVVEDWTERLQELRAQTRTAILTSKRLVDALKHSANRAELFARAPSSSNEKSGGDPTSQTLENASTKLTSSLASLVSSLQNELETSVLSTQMLSSSSKTLQAATQQHDSLTHALDTAKSLLGALEKADWTDRLLVMGAFMFFMACVIYVGWARTVGRGISMIIWLYGWIPGSGSSTAAVVKEQAAKKSLEYSASLASSSISESVVASVTLVSTVASVVASSSVKKDHVTSPSHVVPPEEPDPAPTPFAVPPLEHDDEATVSTVLSSILPPDPQPTQLYDEL